MYRAIRITLLLIATSLLLPKAVLAAQQVFVGAVYQGQIIFTDGPSCPAPGDYPGTGTLTVTNVSGTNFDAVLESLSEPNVLNVDTLGPLTGAFGGNITGPGTIVTNIEGTLFNGTTTVTSGTATPTSITLSATYVYSGGCSGTYIFTGTVASVIINPATSSSSLQSQQGDAQAALGPTGVVGEVAGYTASLLRPRSGGSQRVTANSLHFSSRGLSAGDHTDVPFGVWLSGSYALSEDESTAPFKADRINLTGGLDTSLGDDLIVGVALGLEAADTKTSANNGQADSYGFTVAPYVAYLLNDTLSVDFAAGYSRLTHEQSRGPQRTITSDTNSKRVFITGNGNWAQTYGNWYLSARGGVTWLSSELDGVTESDGTVVPDSAFRIGQFSLGGEAAYSYDEWEPYVGATFNHAYTKTRRRFARDITAPKDDRTDLLLNAGVRFFGDSGLSGGAEYSTLLLRDNFTEHSFQFNIRAEF